MWSLCGHFLPLSKTRNAWLPSTAGQGQTRKAIFGLTRTSRSGASWRLGSSFTGDATFDRPDCQVTIDFRSTPGRRHIPLHRLDWRALRGHTNPRVGASAWSGKTVSDTHFHDFDINWDAAKERFYRSGLRLAREIDPPVPQSFDEVLAWVSREFRIGNLAIIDHPPWEGRLFRGGHDG